LREKRDILDKGAQILLEKEKIEADEIKAVMGLAEEAKKDPPV
jgi:ATP-dependent Zn protease